LLVSASTFGSKGADSSAAAEEVGAFISVPLISHCHIPNPNDILSRVNNCLRWIRYDRSPINSLFFSLLLSQLPPRLRYR
jgi:hypothetical protein